MRQLLVHACLCLMTWSSATGPDPTLPPDNFTSSATNKVLGEPQRVLGERSENIGGIQRSATHMQPSHCHWPRLVYF